MISKWGLIENLKQNVIQLGNKFQSESEGVKMKPIKNLKVLAACFLMRLRPNQELIKLPLSG